MSSPRLSSAPFRRSDSLTPSRHIVKDSYRDYRRLLTDKAVDAVIIATPDHGHCPMVLEAVNAGKDSSCEKGLAHALEEAKRMRDARKRSKMVFQLGHQAGDLLSHELDVAQYLLGHGIPETCQCSGLNALLC